MFTNRIAIHETFTKTGNFLIITYLVLVAILTFLLYLNFPSGYNQGIYHYQGLVLKNGGLPYSDFIEKKGPMGLLTYGMAAVFFGETIMAYRLFDILILCLTAIFLYRLARLQLSKIDSGLVCAFWYIQILVDGPGNTADVTNIITICFVVIAYYLSLYRTKVSFIALGSIIALACWVKPTALLIALPLLVLIFKNKAKLPVKSIFLKLIIGMCIPSVVFVIYLLITGTFYGFWQAVVLDTVLNYTGHMSRFSLRVILKTGGTLLEEPVLRIVGLLGVFLCSKQTIVKAIVIGIGLMIFVEGRLYPYHFSILWPFLAIGVAELKIFLVAKTLYKAHVLITLLLCLNIGFTVYNTGSYFIQQGVFTKKFKAENTFVFDDFSEMYKYRKQVVTYLKDLLNEKDEIFVLGQDPNIYLELNRITTCRLARDGMLLTEFTAGKVPKHVKLWQQELIDYMSSQKADWIIIYKPYTTQWISSYKAHITSIFSEKYKLVHTTEGHLVYNKIDL